MTWEDYVLSALGVAGFCLWPSLTKAWRRQVATERSKHPRLFLGQREFFCSRSPVMRVAQAGRSWRATACLYVDAESVSYLQRVREAGDTVDVQYSRGRFGWQASGRLVDLEFQEDVLSPAMVAYVSLKGEEAPRWVEQ